MFVAKRPPTAAEIATLAKAQAQTFTPPDPDRWNRLLSSMEGVQTHAIGHDAFQFVCPCCHQGIGLGGIARDNQGREEVQAGCQVCGAGFDDIVAKTPRDPLPINRGGFVEPTPKQPKDVAPVSQRRRGFWRR